MNGSESLHLMRQLPSPLLTYPYKESYSCDNYNTGEKICEQSIICQGRNSGYNIYKTYEQNQNLYGANNMPTSEFK